MHRLSLLMIAFEKRSAEQGSHLHFSILQYTIMQARPFYFRPFYFILSVSQMIPIKKLIKTLLTHLAAAPTPLTNNVIKMMQYQ